MFNFFLKKKANDMITLAFLNVHSGGWLCGEWTEGRAKESRKMKKQLQDPSKMQQ